jgi:peroxiredoxin
MPAYEADLERFAGYDAQVLGISVDSVPCNSAWAKSLGNLSYDLLSDFNPKGEVARAYGAYREADGISERAIFIVDKEGKLAYADIHDIADQPDNEDLFEVLRKLE